MDSFHNVLLACQKKGDLTISDLARWFERPRPTVNTWINGRVPFGPQSRAVFQRLLLLREVVQDKRWFPIPPHLTWTERADLIRGVRDAAARHGRVSRRAAAD
jgi:hypothetical protein